MLVSISICMQAKGKRTNYKANQKVEEGEVFRMHTIHHHKDTFARKTEDIDEKMTYGIFDSDTNEYLRVKTNRTSFSLRLYKHML